MLNLFKILVLSLMTLSSAMGAESNLSVESFVSTYNSAFSVLKSQNTYSRGPASVSNDLSAKIQDDFFFRSWSEYKNLSDEKRRSIVKVFKMNKNPQDLKAMLSHIKRNKERLKTEDLIKASELRGQYDALMKWN